MTREEARRRARELVGQMTVEERASQLRYDAPAIERLGVPAYNWWGEALHGVARAGVATSFPQAIAMAATFDTELLRKAGDVAATEGRAKYNAYSSEDDRDIYKGLTFWSPNVNIFRDPRWGRGQETYGEDPYLTSRLGVAYVEGLQGDDDVLKSAACAKHFAVHSGPEAVRHEFNATATKKDMAETYLPAFKACVQEAGVEAVMGAYNRTNGEPCCGSKTLMQDILRGEWDFQGHFVSDCWAIRDFHTGHMVTENTAQSVALALKNGCDLNCGDCYRCLLLALREGRADYAVLPIENSSTGAIRQIYDLLTQYECYMVGETTVRVEHCLMAPKGATLDTITHVYSHEQGLFQCERFLNAHPAWKQVPQADTAGSAKLVADGILRGSGRMLHFMAATFTDLILRVVLAFALSGWLGSPIGIWCAWPIGWSIAMALSLLFYKNQCRRFLS